MAVSQMSKTSATSCTQHRTLHRVQPVPLPSKRCGVMRGVFDASKTPWKGGPATVPSQAVSRREIMVAASILTLGALAQSQAPARAMGPFAGFGEKKIADLADEYTSHTTTLLSEVRQTLDIPRDDPVKEEKVRELKNDINTWVAAYRREPKISGRQSYGQTFSALNALAGHYNSFGYTTPLPKKRMDRVNKELNDAALFLERGR
eukprot:gene12597-15823_t